jgi:hypothetical protein
MRYEQAARVCYAAIRQLREEQGGKRGPVWGLLVAEERGWYLRAVERSALGCTPASVHRSWVAELTAAGWLHGPEIDHGKRTHPDLVPWEVLGEPARRRFFLLQMVAIGLYLPVPSGLTETSPVTAP